MRARDLVNDIVKTGLAPMMKRHGFRKTGLTFTRRQGSVAHLLNLQLSQWNLGIDGRFYVNAGVMFDDMRRLRGWEPPERPTYPDCDFMVRWERLGEGLPPSIEVGADSDDAALAAWLATQVETVFVLPLNAVSSTEDFAKTGWIDAVPWGFPARWHFVTGRRDEARRLVQREADTFADRGLTFDSVAENLGLSF